MAYKGRRVTADDIQPGPWRFTAEIAGWPIGAQMWRYVDAAHNWGRLPSEMGICEPEDDVALMVAYTEVSKLMAAKEAKEAEKKLKAETGKQ